MNMGTGFKKDVFVKHKCPQKWPIQKMAKVTRTNILIRVGSLVTKNAHVQYGTSNIYYLEEFNIKKGQMSRSKGLVPTEWSYH